MKTSFQTKMAQMPAQSERKILEDRIQKDKDFTSGRLSELARYIGFGVVAATFSLLTSDSSFAKAISSSYKWLLVWSSIGGMATVLLDYFHYVMGYRASILASQSSDRKYQKKWLSYKMRKLFFWLKQVVATLSGLLLVVAILLNAFNTPSKTGFPPSTSVKQSDSTIANNNSSK